MTNESRPRKAPKRLEDFIFHDVAPSGHDSNDLKTELKRVYMCAIDNLRSGFSGGEGGGGERKEGEEKPDTKVGSTVFRPFTCDQARRK